MAASVRQLFIISRWYQSFNDLLCDLPLVRNSGWDKTDCFIKTIHLSSLRSIPASFGVWDGTSPLGAINLDF